MQSYDLQYETMLFALPGGLEIDDKSIPKRLEDKIVFQEAKYIKKKSPTLAQARLPNRSKLHQKSK